MNEIKQGYKWCVDLIGVLLTSTAVSYISYLGLKDSETGEIHDFKVLASSIVLHSGSYLLSYLLLLNRDRLFKLPSWVLIALAGSVLCSLTFRIPVNDVRFDDFLTGMFVFGIISLAIMGGGRLVYWMFHRGD